MHRRPKNRLTLFSALVLFVFAVLVVTAMLVGILGYVFLQTGIFELFQHSRFPIWLVLLLVPSILIGTIMTLMVGRRPLRPFRSMIEATREVASGNFDIRLPMQGPKEVQILNASFNDMAKELGSIETLRNDFVDNISHEFKTPVVSIKGFAKLLKKDDLPPERRKEYLDIIIAESERLTNLSSNVLLLSKLEAQNAMKDRAEFQLDEQIRRSILLLEPQCARKSLELEVDLPSTTFLGNEELTHHVWLNLLSNAVKFSPPGGSITVSMAEERGQIAVSVADTGTGMTPEVRERLFDKFYQGDKSRVTEGNGLGLSLARRIVELSGGTIRVESREGEGSTFTVLLPSPAGQ